MKSPFEKVKVQLQLDLREMHVLQHIIGSTLPDNKEKEKLVMYLYNRLTEEINKMNDG